MTNVIAKQTKSLSLEVGRKYYDRKHKVFEIKREMVESEPGYAKGYRFKGEMRATHDTDLDFIVDTIYTVSFKPNGQHIHEGVSSPSDLMGIVYDEIVAGEIEIGSSVGIVDGDKIVSGRCQDWHLGERYRLNTNMFDAITSRIPEKKIDNMAYLVGHTATSGEPIVSMMVIFSTSSTDDDFYLASISNPESVTN